MNRSVLIILAVLAVAFVAATGLAFKSGVLERRDQTPAVGGPFQLVDQTGRHVDERVLQGRWTAVFFGFTQCPEACPTTLFAIGQAEKMLGSEAKDFQTVLISVDPERDTPRQLATYLSNEAFPRRAVGLTGSPAQVGKAARAYHVYYQRDGQGADYTVNHSTITYLMSPRGRFVCVIPYGATPEQIVARVKTAMKAGSKARSC